MEMEVDYKTDSGKDCCEEHDVGGCQEKVEMANVNSESKSPGYPVVVFIGLLGTI